MGFALLFGCDGGKSPRVAAGIPETVPVLAAVSERDLDAYAAGTRVRIDRWRQALQSRHAVDSQQVDSAAARAAGVSVAEFRAIAGAVESALKMQAALAGRAARLDSLRTELMVLRVRADTR